MFFAFISSWLYNILFSAQSRDDTIDNLTMHICLHLNSIKIDGICNASIGGVDTVTFYEDQSVLKYMRKACLRIEEKQRNGEEVEIQYEKMILGCLSELCLPYDALLEGPDVLMRYKAATFMKFSYGRPFYIMLVYILSYKKGYKDIPLIEWRELGSGLHGIFREGQNSSDYIENDTELSKDLRFRNFVFKRMVGFLFGKGISYENVNESTFLRNYVSFADRLYLFMVTIGMHQKRILLDDYFQTPMCLDEIAYYKKHLNTLRSETWWKKICSGEIANNGDQILHIGDRTYTRRKVMIMKSKFGLLRAYIVKDYKLTYPKLLEHINKCFNNLKTVLSSGNFQWGKRLVAVEYNITSAMSVYKNEVRESHKSISEIEKKIRMLYQEYKINERYHTSIVNRKCLSSMESHISQSKQLNSSLKKIAYKQCMHNITHSVNLCILINTELRTVEKKLDEIHEYLGRGDPKTGSLQFSDYTGLFHFDTKTSMFNDVGSINASIVSKKTEFANAYFKYKKIMQFLTRALAALKEDSKPHTKNASLVLFNDLTAFGIGTKIKIMKNCLSLYEELGLKNADVNQRKDVKSSCVAKLSCALKALDHQNHMLLRVILECDSYPNKLHLFKTAMSAIDKELNVSSKYLLEYSLDKIREGDGCFISSLRENIFEGKKRCSFKSFINELSRLRSYISKNFCKEWQSAFIDFDDACYLSAYLTIYDLHSANAPTYSFYAQACELLKQGTRANAVLEILYAEYEMFIKIFVLIDHRNRIKKDLEDENEIGEIIQYISNMSWPNVKEVEKLRSDCRALSNRLYIGSSDEINSYEVTKAIHECRKLLSE